MRNLFCLLVLCAGCYQPVRIIEGWAASPRATYNKHKLDAGALWVADHNWKTYRTVLFNHDSNRPVGVVLENRMIGEKLWVKIAISKTETKLWEQICEGVVSGLSIHVLALEDEFTWLEELDTDGQLVTKAIIIEVSVVSLPANPDCWIIYWYTE